MRTLITALAAFLIIGTPAPAAGTPAPFTARAVALSDATWPPSALRLLYPGQTWTVARDGTPCPRGGYYGDVSAYRWNGSALGAQTWTADHQVTYWRATRGRVTFDGVTFRNRTRDPVLVAGWCQ